MYVFAVNYVILALSLQHFNLVIFGDFFAIKISIKDCKIVLFLPTEKHL